LVLNKIDLPSADVDRTRREIGGGSGSTAERDPRQRPDRLGIPEILEAVMARVPHPRATRAPTRALIFDS
jgi:GTP-binding protein LepA